MFRPAQVFMVVLLALGGVSLFADNTFAKGKYLVRATGGPGPGSPAEAVQLLESFIIPTFEMLMKWEKEGKIVSGIPTGGRAIVMMVEAASNHELDRMLRSLPAWHLLNWKVTPLESVSGRTEIEQETVKVLKGVMK